MSISPDVVDVAVVSDTAVARDETPSLRSVTVVMLLLVIANVPWRPDSIFAGGLDPVVAAKALLTGLALLVALSIRGASTEIRPIRTPPLVLLALYITASVFGAWSAGNLVAGSILAIRVTAIAVVVVLVATSVAADVILDRLFVATTSVALVAAVTGASTISSGRLSGGVPGIHSNELAMLCAVSVLGLMWKVLRGNSWPGALWIVGLLVAVLWSTGSRSSFIAAMVGLALMLAHVRRLHAAAVVGLHVVAAALTYIVLVTDLFGGFLNRGEADGFSTVTSRTIAWSSALSYSDSGWVRWFGAGLSVKEVPVAGQYWNTQVFDSSWISAVVHAGAIGAVVIVVWALWALVVSRRIRRPLRMLMTPLFVYLILRSTLESGLIDSSAAFVVFLTCSLVMDSFPHRSGHDSSVPEHRTVRRATMLSK